MADARQLEKRVSAIASLGYKAEQVDVIRNTVAKEATDAELYMFLYLAKQYGLDPFRREIHFMKDRQGRVSIVTGIDGFRKCARRDPAFEGVQAFAVREGDEFSIDASGFSVQHRFGAKRGKVLGAWAAAYARGRKPVVVWVDFEEYRKAGWDAWERMPATMIAKVAEAQALRRQFGLSGLYTDDELGASLNGEVVDVSPEVEGDAAAVVEETEAHERPSHEQEDSSEADRARRKVFAAVSEWAKESGFDPEEAKEVAKEVLRRSYGVESCSNLSTEQWERVARHAKRFVHAVEMAMVSKIRDKAEGREAAAGA